MLTLGSEILVDPPGFGQTEKLSVTTATRALTLNDGIGLFSSHYTLHYKFFYGRNNSVTLTDFFITITKIIYSTNILVAIRRNYYRI